jgi:hypothetical protein
LNFFPEFLTQISILLRSRYVVPKFIPWKLNPPCGVLGGDQTMGAFHTLAKGLGVGSVLLLFCHARTQHLSLSLHPYNGAA